MNELFDKLMLRILFTIYVCLILILYKYTHALLYPSTRQQIFKKFYPSKNPANSVHFFSRILGIGVIFSSLHFDISDGLILSLIDFFIMGTVGFFLYIASIYIMESIILFNFDYADEITKRKNLSYGIVSFSIAISLAIILRTIISEAASSLIAMLFMWMFAIVIMGFSSKAFKFVSRQPFNRQMIQKSLSLAFSYSGFMFGCALIVNSSFQQKAMGIQNYSITVILHILLAAIIFPLFRYGLVWIFRLEDEFKNQNTTIEPNWGHGLFEGTVFLTACYLTSVITGQVHFGTFYPVF